MWISIQLFESWRRWYMVDQILTIPEVAKYLKISKSKIYYLVQRKEIPHVKIGRNVRIKESELVMWLDKHKDPNMK
jgi:nitrogen PTS system EIIA component